MIEICLKKFSVEYLGKDRITKTNVNRTMQIAYIAPYIFPLKS